MIAVEQERLAKLRAQMEVWKAVHPEAENWDVVFLIKLLDEKQTKETYENPKSAGRCLDEAHRFAS